MTAPVQAPSPLADPTTVALLRDLYAHAWRVRAEHANYSMGDGRGGAYGPKEHTWTAGELRVSYCDGELRYLSHGVPLLKVHVVSVRQAAQVLAAIGVLPPRFAVAAAKAQDTCWTATTGGAL